MPGKRFKVTPLRAFNEDEMQRLVVELQRTFEEIRAEIDGVRADQTTPAAPRRKVTTPDRTIFDIDERLRKLEQKAYEGLSQLNAGFTRGATGGGTSPPPPTDPPPNPPPPPGPGAPARPSNVMASPGDGRIFVTWSRSAGALTYTVRRATTAGGPYTTLISNLDADFHTDVTVTNGTTYYYVVEAVNENGSSGPSLEASATPGSGTAPLSFTEVFVIPNSTNWNSPLDLWAGFTGAGFDSRLYLTMGGRRTGSQHGGAIFFHRDSVGDTDWNLEFQASNLETIAKIRDWTDANGVRWLFAWCETPQSGQSPIIAKGIGSGWAFQPYSFQPSVIGGRGLGVNYFANPQGDVYFGWTNRNGSNAVAVLYRRNASSGVLTQIRSLNVTGMRELEFEPPNILWEFYNDNASGFDSYTFRNGVAIPNPPGPSGGDGVNGATWFPGSNHMYVVARGGGSQVMRWSGSSWDTVLNVAGEADHIYYAPRGGGELWALGKRPFQAWKSTNGTTWTLILEESYPMFNDVNQQTAIALYNNRIWLAAADAGLGVTHIYRET
jgi:hypothetical protein